MLCLRALRRWKPGFCRYVNTGESRVRLQLEKKTIRMLMITLLRAGVRSFAAGDTGRTEDAVSDAVGASAA